MPSALAAYIPEPGKTANVNLNSLTPLNPCPTNNCWYTGSSNLQASWRNWTGAAWAPGFSPYGALVFWGGGHGGGSDVGLYVFDFTTGLWSRVGPANPAQDYLHLVEANVDFYDHLHEGSYIVPGLHTYNYPAYVPPDLPGSGPRGQWLLPQLVGGANSGAKPHAVDLATGVWTRFSTGPGVGGQSPYTGSIEDTRRQRVWWATIGDAWMNMLDLTEPHPRNIHVRRLLPTGSQYGHGGYYARPVYVAETDMVVSLWCFYLQTRVRGEVYDLSRGELVHMGALTLPPLDIPTGAGFGLDWCPHTRAFYLYPGWGSEQVFKLTPSSLEFHECTWEWSEERFAGAVFQASGTGSGAQPFSRWRYVPWLRCFAWTDGPGVSGMVADGQQRDGIVQLWRPLGT